eukprot:gene6251-4500_t
MVEQLIVAVLAKIDKNNNIMSAFDLIYLFPSFLLHLLTSEKRMGKAFAKNALKSRWSFSTTSIVIVTTIIQNNNTNNNKVIPEVQLFYNTILSSPILIFNLYLLFCYSYVVLKIIILTCSIIYNRFSYYKLVQQLLKHLFVSNNKITLGLRSVNNATDLQRVSFEFLQLLLNLGQICVTYTKVVVGFPRNPSGPNFNSDLRRQRNIKELNFLLTQVKSFAACNGIQINETVVSSRSSGTSEGTEDWYSQMLMALITDQELYQNYIELLRSESVTFSGSSKPENFSSLSPKSVIKYYYDFELPHFNFEAEIQLQNRLPPAHHEPMFSATFNDPIHALRRGYGLEGSIYVAVVSSPFIDAHEENSYLSTSVGCQTTVKSVFQNAYTPSNVFVGVADVVDADTRRCEPTEIQSEHLQESLGFTFSDHVRTRRVHLPRGKVKSRSKVENIRNLNEKTDNRTETSSSLLFTPEDPIRFAVLQLYRGESYVLLIKEGTLLAPGWDWRVKLLFLHEHSHRRKTKLSNTEHQRYPWSPSFVLSSSSSYLGSALADAFLSTAAATTGWSPEGGERRLFDESRNSDVTGGKLTTQIEWSIDLLRQVLRFCPSCAFFLAVPTYCWTMDIEKRVLGQMEAQFAREPTNAIACIARNALVSLLSSASQQRGTEERNAITHLFSTLCPTLSIQYQHGSPGVPSNTMRVAVEEFYTDDTLFSQERRSAKHVIRTPVVDEDPVHFLVVRGAAESCGAAHLVNEEKNTLNKEVFELCWFKFYKKSVMEVYRSMESVENTPTHSAPSRRTRTIAIPAVPEAQTLETLLQSSPDLWAPMTVKEVEESSRCLFDMAYLDDALGQEQARAPSVPFASLDFLFAPAETFFDFPEELKLDIPEWRIPSHEEPRRGTGAAPVTFDPFLPSLSAAEADLLVSAKLWTGGHDIVALTEPLAFSAAPHVFPALERGAGEAANLIRTGDPGMDSARDGTVQRLQSIFRTALGLSVAQHGSNVRVGSKYSFAGRARNVSSYVELAGVQPMVDALLRMNATKHREIERQLIPFYLQLKLEPIGLGAEGGPALTMDPSKPKRDRAYGPMSRPSPGATALPATTPESSPSAFGGLQWRRQRHGGSALPPMLPHYQMRQRGEQEGRVGLQAALSRCWRRAAGAGHEEGGLTGKSLAEQSCDSIASLVVIALVLFVLLCVTVARNGLPDVSVSVTTNRLFLCLKGLVDPYSPMLNQEFADRMKQRLQAEQSTRSGWRFANLKVDELTEELSRGRLDLWLFPTGREEEKGFLDTESLMYAWKLQNWVLSFKAAGKVADLSRFLLDIQRSAPEMHKEGTLNSTAFGSLPSSVQRCLANNTGANSTEPPSKRPHTVQPATDPRNFFLDSSLLHSELQRSSPRQLVPGGFLRATGSNMPETEARRPMDDFALLKLRYQSLVRSARGADMEGWKQSMQLALRGSSVLNRRYYHPVRRYSKVQPYAPHPYAETVAWEEAVALHHRYRHPTPQENHQEGQKMRRAARPAFYIPYLASERIQGLKNSFEWPQKQVMPPDPPSSTGFDADTLSVFISVASYRDAECGATLFDAFHRSKNPYRVYVGVAEQAVPTSPGFSPDPTHDASCVAEELYRPMQTIHPAPQTAGAAQDWFDERPPPTSCPGGLELEEPTEASVHPLPKQFQRRSPFKRCWRGEWERQWEAREALRDRRRTAFATADPPYSPPLDAAAACRGQRGGGVAGIVNGRPATPEEDADLYTSYIRSLFVPEEHIRRRRINAHHARGPTFGRYMAMLLFRGEDFVLVIDSHHRFVPHWDVMAIYWFKAFKDPRAALSHYPEAFEESNDFKLERPSSAYLCQAKFLEQRIGYIRLSAIVVNELHSFEKNNAYNVLYEPKEGDVALDSWASNLVPGCLADRLGFAEEPPLLGGVFKLPQPWIAGGFLFARGILLREVPFDPHLPMLFDGEEVLYGVRMWTHGYNVYSPPRNLAYHLYGREKAPKIWGDESGPWNGVQPLSQKRVQYLLRSRFKKEDATLSSIPYPDDDNTQLAAEQSLNRAPGSMMIPDEYFDVAGDTVSAIGANRSTAEVLQRRLRAAAEEQYFLWSHRNTTHWLLLRSSDRPAATGNNKSLAVSVYSPPAPHQHPLEGVYLQSFIKVDLLRYGMGSQRSVSQWYEFAGVDPVKHTVDNRWCGSEIQKKEKFQHIYYCWLYRRYISIHTFTFTLYFYLCDLNGVRVSPWRKPQHSQSPLRLSRLEKGSVTSHPDQRGSPKRESSSRVQPFIITLRLSMPPLVANTRAGPPEATHSHDSATIPLLDAFTKVSSLQQTCQKLIQLHQHVLLADQNIGAPRTEEGPQLAPLPTGPFTKNSVHDALSELQAVLHKGSEKGDEEFKWRRRSTPAGSPSPGDGGGAEELAEADKRFELEGHLLSERYREAATGLAQLRACGVYRNTTALDLQESGLLKQLRRRTMACAEKCGALSLQSASAAVRAAWQGMEADSVKGSAVSKAQAALGEAVLDLVVCVQELLSTDGERDDMPCLSRLMETVRSEVAWAAAHGASADQTGAMPSVVQQLETWATDPAMLRGLSLRSRSVHVVLLLVAASMLHIVRAPPSHRPADAARSPAMMMPAAVTSALCSAVAETVAQAASAAAVLPGQVPQSAGLGPATSAEEIRALTTRLALPAGNAAGREPARLRSIQHAFAVAAALPYSAAALVPHGGRPPPRQPARCTDDEQKALTEWFNNGVLEKVYAPVLQWCIQRTEAEAEAEAEARVDGASDGSNLPNSLLLLYAALSHGPGVKDGIARVQAALQRSTTAALGRWVGRFLARATELTEQLLQCIAAPPAMEEEASEAAGRSAWVAQLYDVWLHPPVEDCDDGLMRRRAAARWLRCASWSRSLPAFEFFLHECRVATALSGDSQPRALLRAIMSMLYRAIRLAQVVPRILGAAAGAAASWAAPVEDWLIHGSTLLMRSANEELQRSSSHKPATPVSTAALWCDARRASRALDLCLALHSFAFVVTLVGPGRQDRGGAPTSLWRCGAQLEEAGASLATHVWQPALTEVFCAALRESLGDFRGDGEEGEEAAGPQPRSQRFQHLYTTGLLTEHLQRLGLQGRHAPVETSMPPPHPALLSSSSSSSRGGRPGTASCAVEGEVGAPVWTLAEVVVRLLRTVESGCSSLYGGDDRDEAIPLEQRLLSLVLHGGGEALQEEQASSPAAMWPAYIRSKFLHAATAQCARCLSQSVTTVLQEALLGMLGRPRCDGDWQQAVLEAHFVQGVCNALGSSAVEALQRLRSDHPHVAELHSALGGAVEELRQLQPPSAVDPIEWRAQHDALAAHAAEKLQHSALALGLTARPAAPAPTAQVPSQSAAKQVPRFLCVPVAPGDPAGAASTEAPAAPKLADRRARWLHTVSATSLAAKEQLQQRAKGLSTATLQTTFDRINPLVLRHRGRSDGDQGAPAGAGRRAPLPVVSDASLRLGEGAAAMITNVWSSLWGQSPSSSSAAESQGSAGRRAGHAGVELHLVESGSIEHSCSQELAVSICHHRRLRDVSVVARFPKCLSLYPFS